MKQSISLIIKSKIQICIFPLRGGFAYSYHCCDPPNALLSVLLLNAKEECFLEDKKEKEKPVFGELFDGKENPIVGFFNSVTTDSSDQVILCGAGPSCALQDIQRYHCPIPVQMLGAPLPPVVTIKNTSRYCQNVSWGQKSPLVEHYILQGLWSFFKDFSYVNKWWTIREGKEYLVFLWCELGTVPMFFYFILQIKKLRFRERKEPAEKHKTSSTVKSGLQTRLA